MELKTFDEVKDFFLFGERFFDKCEDIAIIKLDLDGQGYTLDNYCFASGLVEITLSKYQYGETVTQTVNLTPEDILSDHTKIIEEREKRKEAEKIAKEQKTKALLKDLALEKEKREKAEYQRLKKKFENGHIN